MLFIPIIFWHGFSFRQRLISYVDSFRVCGSKVKDENKDEEHCSRTCWYNSSIWNGSFAIDFPNVDSQGFCLTEDWDWTGYAEDIPVWPIKSWCWLSCCVDKSCSFTKIRPDASTTPVTIPGRASGMTTWRTVSQRESPSAKPASRCVWVNVLQTVFKHYVSSVEG